MSGTVGIPGVLSASAAPGAVSASALGTSMGVGLPSVANAINAASMSASSPAGDDATYVMPTDGSGAENGADASAAASDDASAAADAAQQSSPAMVAALSVGLPTMKMPSMVSWSPSPAGMYTGLWILAALAGVIALVALIIAVLAYVGQNNSACGKKKCCEMKRDLRALKQGFLASQTLLGMWSYTSDDTLTGTVAATPMLFSAATPLPGAPSVDAQEGTSSVINMPFADAVSSLAIQLSDVPASGAVTVTMTLNSADTALTATVSSTDSTPFAAATLPTPLKVKKGDLVGLTVAASALDITAPPVVTAQLFRVGSLCLL